MITRLPRILRRRIVAPFPTPPRYTLPPQTRLDTRRPLRHRTLHAAGAHLLLRWRAMVGDIRHHSAGVRVDSSNPARRTDWLVVLVVLLLPFLITILPLPMTTPRLLARRQHHCYPVDGDQDIA